MGGAFWSGAFGMEFRLQAAAVLIAQGARSSRDSFRIEGASRLKAELRASTTYAGIFWQIKRMSLDRINKIGRIDRISPKRSRASFGVIL